MRPFMFVELSSVATPVTVSLDTVTAQGEFDCGPPPPSCPFSKTVISNTVNATATGGTPGYTYSWLRVSGDTTITATNATSASTTFQASVSRNIPKNGVWELLVLDSLGSPALSALVTVQLIYQYDSGS